jgi:bifunctional enzyme CysN/CysC
MVTGASTADLAIILIDARKGVIEQTKRHAFIASLLGIRHLVVAVNKMDLVGFDQERFEAIKADFCAFAQRLAVADIVFIPLSALQGDNVVERSRQMPWYHGAPLLEHLETVAVQVDVPLEDLRLPVQYVIRDGHSDYRGYAGQLASGVLHAGEEVLVLPGGQTTTIASIDTFNGPITHAYPPMSVTVRLADELDVSRGNLICRPTDRPALQRDLIADLCWMGDEPLRCGGRYLVKHATNAVPGVVDAIDDRLDIHSLQREPAPDALALNDIGRVRLRTAKPLTADPYRANRRTGSFILIDEATNDTVAAGVLMAEPA